MRNKCKSEFSAVQQIKRGSQAPVRRKVVKLSLWQRLMQFLFM